MTEGERAEEEPKPYSKAFETFVKPEEEGEDDVIGLLAYALYKQSVREDAIAGNAVPQDRRSPTDTSVQAYRGAARQLLTGVIDRAIEDSTPDIQESGLRDAVIASEANVKAHVDQRTSFKTALLTNLAAWLISLAIAFLILVLARAPALVDFMVQSAAPEPRLEQQPQSQAPPPPPQQPPARSNQTGK